MHQIPRSTPRHLYELTIVYSGQDKLEVRTYPSLEALGEAAYWLHAHRGCWLKSLTATSEQGRTFAVEELMAAAGRRIQEGYVLRQLLWQRGSLTEPAYRRAPVPRTGRRTSYGRSWLRRPRTEAERRLNALVVFEDGEVPARNRRRGRALPSSWDDIPREIPRGWKDQHKGRKSWDKPGR